MITDEDVILHTQEWIKQVVIGCHFCPFAAAPVRNNAVRYVVMTNAETEKLLQLILDECFYLDEHELTSTSFIIVPESLTDFRAYLDFLGMAEDIMKNSGYEGIYQVAGFHPDYLFAGSDENDAANYTNRSVYPMFHLIREAEIDIALENYREPMSIPERNIDFARKKGLTYMKMLRDSVMHTK